MDNLYGKLSRGCELCLRGDKLPIYTSFRCNKKCYYCPIIPRINGKDITMVAGREINSINDIIPYIEKLNGMAISGGEPLLTLDKTLKIIELARRKKGENFHIHMYTNGKLLTEAIMGKLIGMGLDEIRIHSFDLNIFRRMKKFDIEIVAEIPCAPNDEKKFIEFIHSLDDIGIKFMNINEMQSSTLALPEFEKRGFKIVGNRVIGSEETVLNIIKQIKKDGLNISVHYCPIRQEIANAGKRLELLGI